MAARAAGKSRSGGGAGDGSGGGTGDGAGPETARVLVLGADGRIGTLLRRFAPAPPHWHPRWQARRPPPPIPGPATAAPDGVMSPGPATAAPDWVICDPLADPAALARAAEGAAAVLCLAGVTPARAADSADPEAALDANRALARAALQAAARGGADRVLLASSAAVYGARAGRLPEELAPAPRSAYGRAKAAMEAEAAELGAALGLRVCALRIGNVAGADAILGGWRPGFELDVFADGRSPRRSYVGPRSLARILAALCLRADLPPALNLAAPGAVEMGALLDAAGLGWTPRPAPPDAIPEVELDTGRLAALVPLAPGLGQPAALVAEWRGSRPAQAGNTPAGDPPA